LLILQKLVGDLQSTQGCTYTCLAPNKRGFSTYISPRMAEPACGRPAAHSGLYLHLPGNKQERIINMNIPTDNTTNRRIELLSYHPFC